MSLFRRALTCALIGGLLGFTQPAGAASPSTRFLSQPSIGPDAIAFVHANDVWVVGRDGGVARRLTSGEGAETDPAFSPDGRWIAFTGEYGGNADVYVVPAAGGQPLRLTWHPGPDAVQGWTPDGQVIFRSSREGVPTHQWRFYTIPPAGGLPLPLPVHQAYRGEMNEDGTALVYQEIGYWDPEWRNYRGGQAQPVRIVSLPSLALQMPPWEGERQMDPKWMNGVVYYLSERDWAGNVWSYDPRTGRETQLTHHADFDVKSLDAGHGVVVYEQAGYLHEFDVATGAARPLEIQAAADQNWASPRWEEIRPRDLANPRLSPTGTRALFEYRGDLFTVPVEEGSWRNLTRSPGVADRYPVWSPDGKRIAWFSDAGGEYAVVVADQFGGDPRRIAIPRPSFYFVPEWSPDGTRLAFTDTDYRVWIMDLASGKLTHVDTDGYAHPERSMNPVWSPDSRYLAYARRLDTQLRAIVVHDTRTGENHRITDGMADAISPVWDAGGKYLYFLASTNYALRTGWLDMTSYERPVRRALYTVVLKAGDESPFRPLSDEEPGGKKDAAEAKAQAGAKAGRADAKEGAAKPPEVTIDFGGIESRIVAAPELPERDYPRLAPGPENVVFVAESVPHQRGDVLHRYDVKERKPTEFSKGVDDLAVSHDRRKILIRAEAGWTVAGTDGKSAKPAAAGADAGGREKGKDGRLDFTGMRIRIEPRAEWAQMLREGWRLMRDFLYVDNQHGAPWDDVWTWYSAWLPDVEHRSDFNQLLDMLSGEIAVGHSYVHGGDYPDLLDPKTGLLGVDLEAAGGGYRITRVYTGEHWNPDLTGPLAEPGMEVRAGDWLVAIDGRELQPPQNPYALLEGTAGRTITVSVNRKPGMDGARRLVVKPLESELELRRWAWVEDNRRTVSELSGDRLAYVYLPNTGQGGYTYFNRMYFAQQDRAGAVIDERNNGGGSAADYIVDIMNRRLTGYFNSKAGDHRPWTQPMAGLWGPKVMVINERAGSGGDLLPYLFRLHGIGPLVGMRTWGGLVGTWDSPPLLDGGRFVAPRGGFFDADGQWAVEGVGVAPDIEVMNTPAEVAAGHDPQLEAAVEEALRRLETEAVELRPEPPAPVRYRRPARSAGER